jgi:hypothetical protein
MFLRRLACALTLAVTAVYGGAEPPDTPDAAPAPAFAAVPGRDCQGFSAPAGATGLFLSSKETPPLDDEVEVPDEEEDDEPDDPGQAHDPDSRPVPFPAGLHALSLDPVAPAARPHPLEGAQPGREPARFLSLCRILC